MGSQALSAWEPGCKGFTRYQAVPGNQDARVLYQIRVRYPLYCRIGGEGEKLAPELKKGVSNPDLVLLVTRLCLGTRIQGFYSLPGCAW